MRGIRSRVDTFTLGQCLVSFKKGRGGNLAESAPISAGHKPGSVLCGHFSRLQLALKLEAAYPPRVLRARRADGQSREIRGAYLALHPVEFTGFHYCVSLSPNPPYLLSVALFLTQLPEPAAVSRYGALGCPDFPLHPRMKRPRALPAYI